MAALSIERLHNLSPSVLTRCCADYDLFPLTMCDSDARRVHFLTLDARGNIPSLFLLLRAVEFRDRRFHTRQLSLQAKKVFVRHRGSI